MQNHRVQADGVRTAGEEVDLFEYGLALWRRRWLIAGLTTAVTAAVLVLGLLSPRIYQARAVILTPPLLEGVETRSTRVFAFESAVQNPTVVQKALSQAGQAGNFSADRFARENIAVDPGRDSTTLVLTVRMPGTELAAGMADRLAELAVERLRQLSGEEAKRTQPLLKAQAEEARRVMERAAAELRTAARRSGIAADRAPGLASPRLSPADPIYTDDPSLTQLDVDYRIARGVYEDFSGRLEKASVQQRAQAQQYTLLERGVSSPSPVAPRVVRNTVIAAVLGFVAAAFLVLFFDALRRLAGRAPRP